MCVRCVVALCQDKLGDMIIYMCYIGTTTVIYAKLFANYYYDYSFVLHIF